MTRYFAGNSMAAFSRSASTVQEDSTSGKFDSTYVPYSLSVLGDGNYAETAPFSATGTIWFRWTESQVSSGNASNTGPQVNNGATGIWRMTTQSGYVQQCQYWNGTAWTNTGSGFAMTNTTNVMVLKLNLTTGAFDLFRAGVNVASGTGWTGYQTTATVLRLYGKVSSSSVRTYYSEVMIADYDISNSHYLMASINGNSSANNGAASGTYTDVNETVLNDATFIAISTSGNKAGLTKAAISLPAGYDIKSAIVSARGLAAGSITDGKLGIRSGGGINSSSSGRGFGAVFSPKQAFFNTDPDTSAGFTQSGFNNAEIYLEAA